MYTEERHDKILDLLNEKKSLSVKELSSLFNFSLATIRSDLNYLSRKGLLVRTHGGATVANSKNEIIIERSYSIRSNKNQAQKKEIAKAAYTYIYSGQCIILDASSTCYELAQLLKDTPMRLTILTNGLKTADLLKDNPNITLILIGGIVKGASNAVEGLIGTDILTKFNIDCIFISAHAFNLIDGLSDFSLYEVELKQRMIEVSTKVLALLDSSKLEKNSIATFAATDQITTLITNKEIDNQLKNSYLQAGMTIVTPS